MALGLIVVVAVVAVVLITSLAPAARPAPRLIESVFQDDDHLLYAPTATVEQTLATLAALGVDRLRLTILWRAVAPTPSSTVMPHFDATDPAAYPRQAWGPYDRIVALARAHGIGVDFDVTAPGPLWAMAPGAHDPKTADHYRPSGSAFGQFVEALGRRYSGSYVPPGSSSPLPRVNYWSIWNEPNQPGWLAPQWQNVGGQPVMQSAPLYRQSVDAAFTALERTGHGPGSDTILIGELAPEGSEGTGSSDPVPPMPFLRALYCVDGSYQPLKGAAAASLGCPQSGSSSAFIGANPALFDATGFAHHPYSFFLAPSLQMSDQNFVPLSDLSRLEDGLDKIFSSYGVNRQLPLYLTEYGYETNPPNPFRGVSPAMQAEYLDEGQYMAWKDPRVRAFTQFLLYDALPDRSYPPGTPGYWSTFQTGLLYANGVRKPSFYAYRLPVFIPNPVFAAGRATQVWGMLRLGPNGTSQSAQIQWRTGSGAFRTLTTVQTHDPSGFLNVNVQLPGPGAVRIAWRSPSGQLIFSRQASVLGGAASSG